MGASTTMGVRFSEEERTWIEQYAVFTGKTASEVIREAVLETIEDAVDVYEFENAIAEDDGVRYTFEEVLAELGDA